MGVNSEILYLKIEQNTIVFDRHVVLNDIAKMECTNEAILRQLKQKKIYSFTNQIKVFSVLKIIEQIHEDYPSLTISNEGESDFIIEYIPDPEKPKVMNAVKTVLLCIIIFFGSAFTIMAFNNDISVTDVFDKLYGQVMGIKADGVNELEVCYCIGLGLGIILFFNHVGRKKITPDPTPIQIEMRKYEKDVDTTFIENAGRGGHSIDVS